MKIVRKDLKGRVDIATLAPRDTFRWCGEVYMILADGTRASETKVTQAVCMTVPRPFTGEIDHGTYVVPVDTEMTITEKK